MDRFEYSMKENQFKRYKTQRWIFLILGIVYTMLSIIFYFEGRAISYAYFIGGVLMIVFGFLDMKFVDGYKISFDSDGIKFNSPGSPILKSGRINLGWDDIKSYHIAPVRIDLKLKDESKKSIPLDALGYNDVRLVKDNFTKFAERYY